MKQEKQQYLSPQLTVVFFATERGFAQTTRAKLGSTADFFSSSSDFSVGESRTDGETSIW